MANLFAGILVQVLRQDDLYRKPAVHEERSHLDERVIEMCNQLRDGKSSVSPRHRYSPCRMWITSPPGTPKRACVALVRFHVPGF